MEETRGAAASFAVLDHVPVGAFVLRADFVVLFWNNCLEDWTGLARSEIVGTNIGAHFPHLNTPRYKARLRDIFQGGPPIIFSSQLHKHIIPASLSNGQFRIQHTTVLPVSPAVNGEFHALFSMQDVTELTRQAQNYRLMRDRAMEEIAERERVEEALRQAKEVAEAANRAKSDFLTNMSHELRTPLNAILGFSQIMQRDPALTAEQRENLRIINRSGEHLLELINDVLNMSKIEAGQVVLNENDFDLYRLLDDMENMFCLRATDKGLLLHFERSADLPQYVHTDEGKLRQVLINLLSNAVKFTSQGYVSLQASVAQRASPLATLDFKVSDSGPGIAPDELESVFQVFVQTESGRQSHQGTGLGLPISRQYVQLMGGELSVESTLGQGAVFRFCIQVGQAQATAAQPQRPVRRVIGLEPDQPTYQLLVVDDSLDNRLLLVKLLEPLGFEIQQASNGRQGLEAWEQWRPDLILTDIRMPVMDGHEAIRRIRATPRGQSTIIIALTACAFEEEQETVLSSGCDDLLCKPFHEAEILDKLAQYLGVRYVYEDEALDDSAPAGKGARKPLSAADLAALPAELLADLRQAAQEINLDKVSALVAQISQTDEPLAQALAELVEGFRFDTLQALIEEMEQ